MSRLRHPPTTVRWRLTLLYGGLFLVSGVALLAITYTLVEHATVTRTPPAQAVYDRAIGGSAKFKPGLVPPAGATLKQNFARITGPQAAPVTVSPGLFRKVLLSKGGHDVIRFVGSQQRISDLHQLVLESSIALAIMALISAGLGWVVAGRVLAPLRTMAAATQHISAANLNERLGMRGPRDELRTLAETIDELLERLERAFEAQKRFVANASHELRTPLTAARALLEMILSDPHATVETFRETCEQVLEEGEQQEQLIDALLALAQGQRGLDRREIFDLAAVTDQVAQTHEGEAAARRVQLDCTLHAAPVSGDRRLIERLVTNLLENALRHNVPGGEVNVAVSSRAARATLLVSNTGPVVPADEVNRLLQPFQRMARDRAAHHEGLGLGLSIVAAVASAHSATLQIAPGDRGGLVARVEFPPVREERPSTPTDDHHRADAPAPEPVAGSPVQLT
jgi:signal transduction histidine kinase